MTFLNKQNHESVYYAGESIAYKGYDIRPIINYNPYLFHNWDAGPEDSPKRRVGKTVYLVSKQGYADGTYFKTIAGAKRFIKEIVKPRG